MSVNPARSNKITASDNSDISLAVSSILGEHPAPSDTPPKSYMSQIDGAIVGVTAVGGMTGGAAGAIPTSEGAIVGSNPSVGGAKGTGAFTGAFTGAGIDVAGTL